MKYAVGAEGLSRDALYCRGRCLLRAALILFYSIVCFPGQADCSDGLSEPGPLFRIGGSPVHGQGASFRATPDAAFDGTNYFAVWADARNGSDDIYGARVSPSGEVLDPEGIPISAGPWRKQTPCIAFSGMGYLVVWADDRNGSWDIYGSRVSSSGEVMDPEGIPISTALLAQLYPSVAFSGSRYLVVWHDERTEYVDVRGARVTGSGSVLDDAGFVIASAIAPEEPPGPGGLAGPDGPWGPKVAGDGSGFFVVWQSGWDEQWDVFGSRVTSDGSVLDSPPIVVTTTEAPDWYPDVTFGGTDYLVVWHGVSGSFDVFGARVSTSGTVLDPDPIFISERRFWQRFPTAAYDGTNFLVAWANWTHSAQTVHIARVTPSGTVLDPVGMPAITARSNVQWRASMAFDGTNYLVLCQDARSMSGANVYGALVDRSGRVVTSGDVAVSPKGNGPWEPDVAFAGGDFMVVWSDPVEGSGDLFGARVSGDGVLLDDDALPVVTSAGRQVGPAIAFDGEDCMVVWHDGRGGSWDIYGARMRPSGYVYDPGGIRFTSSSGNELFPAVAFSGSDYLLVWEDQRGGASDIYGMRVTPSGKSLDPGGRLITAAGGMQRRPAVAFDGENYLVVWEDYRGGSGDIYGARITPDFSVPDAGGVPISADSDEEWAPAISFDGEDFLVVWETWNGGSGDIRGARVSTSGPSLIAEGEIAISAANGRQWAPTTQFNGTYHIVAWGDSRNGGGNTDVYAARVSTLGGVIDPDGVGVSTEGDHQLMPAVAAAGSGRLLVAHSWLRPASIFGYWRIWGVAWTPPQDPPLDLTLSVHQNPELTAELDIYLVPSKAVQDASVEIEVNGLDLEAAPTEEEGSIYRAGHRLSAPGPLSIAARAKDLAGVQEETSRVFGAGFISADDGGEAAGPHRKIRLRVRAGSVTRDSYFVIGPESAGGDRFTLSPPSLVLGYPATLTVLVGPDDPEAEEGLRSVGTATAAASPDGGAWAGTEALEEVGPGASGVVIRPSLWREGPHGWEPVESLYDERGGELTASVGRLGRFEVVWEPGEGRRGTEAILLRNVPNPFHTVVDVRYYMPREGRVSVSVYDTGGRLVKQLFEGRRGPGWWSESWDGADASGTRLPSGIYFTDLRAGSKHVGGKCVLVR